MKNTLRSAVVTIIVIIAMVLAYRSLAVRVVNYEIAGIRIPSRYNIITGNEV